LTIEKKDIKRAKQLTGSYCGPAVFEMLVSPFGIDLNQEVMVDACNARKKAAKNGVSLAELAHGLKRLYPDLNVWRKNEASIQDIQAVLERGYVVGLDWQGIFSSNDYGDDKLTFGDKLSSWWQKISHQPLAIGDQGHYSIALEVNMKKGYIRFADPYGHYAGKDRFVAIWEFEERWWDDMVEKDNRGEKVYVFEKRLMFVVTPKEDKGLLELGLGEIIG